MKLLLAFVAVAGTLGIGGNASATPGLRWSLLDNVRNDTAVIRRHEAFSRLGSGAPNTPSRPVSTLHDAAAFDWSDAAVGFGSGIALIGLAGALRRRAYRGARAV
jgi:hypothetical protein